MILVVSQQECVGQISKKSSKNHMEKGQKNTHHYIFIPKVKLSKIQENNRTTTSKTRE
jgi:hypothetical protein